MNRSHRPALYAALAALLTSAACADQPPTGLGPDDEASAAKGAQQPQQKIWTSDDEFARASRAEVPGFAGFYFEEDGTPVILLKDHRQRATAERYLARELADAAVGGVGSLRAPVVRKVTHDFADLKGWFDKLQVLMAREDVHMLDVDEVGNRVFVGVSNEAAVRLVRREAARLQVPPGVLNVEIREPFQMQLTLQEKTSYLAGGFKIEAFTDGGCTLGFNATWVGIRIFVTNSHCTYDFLAYDGGTFTQPDFYAGNEIGTEITDKALYNCNNSTLICRWSDAAYVQHTSTRTIAQGKIARTEIGAFGSPAPNLTVLGYYDIVRRYASVPAVGLSLTKTGMRTGTTFGNITQACIAIDGYDRRTGKYYNYPCQDISNVHAGPGDSGSAMFKRVTTTEVELYGILWGGNATSTASSRLANIERDLGTLTALCIPTAGC